MKKINVVKARTTTSGSAVIEFPSSDSMKAAKAKIEADHGDKFSCEKPKKMSPKMTLIGVPKDIPDIRTAILDLNEKVNHLVVDKQFNFEILFKYEVKEKLNVVLKMHPDIRNAIHENGSYIYLPMIRIRAIDRYHIIHCYHCQNFSHMASKCPYKDKPMVCGKCTASHKASECKSLTLKCALCVKLKNINHDHICGDRGKCQSYKIEQDRIRANTDYGNAS